jgi:hypothetical protein
MTVNARYSKFEPGYARGFFLVVLTENSGFLHSAKIIRFYE